MKKYTLHGSIGIVGGAALIAFAIVFTGFVAHAHDGHDHASSDSDAFAQQVESDASGDASAEMTVCTMDAYQCPGGSWVGRSGPDCEFVCPDGSVHGRGESSAGTHEPSAPPRPDGVPDDTDTDGIRDIPISDRATDSAADGGATSGSVGDGSDGRAGSAGAQPKIVENERATDPDSDDDGVGDAEERANYNNSRSNRATVRVDASTPELMQRLSVDASSPALYEGVSLSVRADACVGEECDQAQGQNEEARAAGIQDGDVALRVSGASVRDWSDEQKEEVRQRLETSSEVNTANDFGIWVAGQAIENEDITEIAADEEQAEVRYTTQLRLFGFIPWNAEAVARATADGEARVHYPWYSFLTRTNGDEDTYTQLAAEIRQSYDQMRVAVEAE